ncbi:MAG: LytTR family DNA-binding domain-containing protein [Flavobacteriaceae bacterium]
MTLNCVVVDDSKIQRLSIIKLIKGHDSLNFIDEYSSALICKENLYNHQVDLIFLDIEMPDLTGFQFLDLLENKPQIIFITGKTQYAFKAFNYDATDYLHKPITRERFNAAVNKALKQQKLKNPINVDDNYMIIRSKHKKHKVFNRNIKWVEALGDYIKLVTDEKSFIILSTMKAFENELPEEKFLRIHKSYIVNLTKIERFSPKMVEIDNSEIPLSRNKKTLLVDALKTFERHNYN